MLEYVLIALLGVVAALIIFAPKMKNRGHSDPRGQNMAEAKSSLAFRTDDESRAVEYEHRFSGTRTGMMLDRSGYKIGKSEDQKHRERRG
ncbi:MAG: hypothetical protein E4H14_11200 [Candidatus Thorarchaeota archaeon]|nr:MAG: hypothetical protein E4H14_11200 [Candidatus Thorarchaeota archaeon]